MLDDDIERYGAFFPTGRWQKAPMGFGAMHRRTLFWWYDPKVGYNFGDWIGPYLFRKLCGKGPVFFLPGRGPAPHTTFSVGSILHIIPRNDTVTVWGSGSLTDAERIPRPRQVLAVRGPKTRKWLEEQGHACPEVYGDPGVLLPLLFRPEGSRHAGLTVLPHFKDTVAAKSHFGDRASVRFISVQADVETVVSQIAAAEALLTSSLHGLIVAHAYGVPVLWAGFKGTPPAHPHKYHDYFLSGGVTDLPDQVFLDGSEPIDDLIRLAAAAPVPDHAPLRAALARTCPFPVSPEGRRTLDRVAAD